MTRAKFVCHSVTKHLHYRKDGGFLYTASLQAVIDNSPENESFFDATPSGEIKLSTLRDDHFEPGAEYYVDFTPATEEG